MTERWPDHTIQFAFFGDRLVLNTEKLSDDEVRLRAWDPPRNAKIERFNRYIKCECWTTVGGKLDPDSACPAVQEALKSGAPKS
jgi:hypothetical protein